MAEAKKGPKKAPEGETKAQKFTRLGTARINKAVKSVRALVALSNKSQYEYTDDQVKLIKTKLNEAVDDVANAFAGKTVTTEEIKL